jgi:iron complex outermembrane receptor protein
MKSSAFLGVTRLGIVLGIAILHARTLPGAAAAPQDKKDAQAPQEKPPDVTDIDLDDLMKVHVTTAGRKEQALNDVPSAIYVLREEDLKRSGVTSIPEALRAVPGLDVARIRANSWAVSSRGFNSTSANKLLVLIDGRSVYSPLHSGVFWEVQDTFLEDVDRIEVIRGPGASLWGANAINGVINIITKKSGDTQGGIVTAGGGTEERMFGGGRVGGKIGEDAYLRVYAKYYDRANALDGVNPDKEARDGGWMGRAGFRSDWKGGDKDRFTLMGDFYDGAVKTVATDLSLTAPPITFNDRTGLRGGNLLFRWEREMDATSSLSFQAYYDYTYRTTEPFTDTLHTGDLDFQYRFRLAEGQDVIWGLGYRIYRSDILGGFLIQFDPPRHTDGTESAFVQDEITLVKDHLRLTLGAKFEYNHFTGFEIEPSARLAWNPDDRQLFWASAARAVRTPSLIDVDFRANAAVLPGPTILSILTDDRFKTEDVLAYEAGYRVRPVDPLSLDLSLFYNRYDHLRSLESGALFGEATPAPAHFVQPFYLRNGMRAQTGGVEVAANLQPMAGWLLQANYTYLRMELEGRVWSNDTTSQAAERQNPRHQVWVRSALDLPWNLTLDVTGRYVSGLSAYQVDDYIEADVRLAWRDNSRRWEAAVVGQNLVHASHPEFNTAAQRSEIPRGVYASLTCRF